MAAAATAATESTCAAGALGMRLCWRGVKPINVSAPVKYLSAAEGGVSHFNYWRDNKLLTWMHTRLCIGFLLRLPVLLWRRLVD